MKKKNFYITNTYLTNFKPRSNLSISKFVFEEKSETIFCKNFLLFILLLKYSSLENNLDTSFFVKHTKKNVYTSLRSPYRHKLARHQFWVHRYQINANFFFYMKKKINFSNISELFYFFDNLKSLSGWFETNLVYQHKIKIKFYFNFKNNFILNNYK